MKKRENIFARTWPAVEGWIEAIEALGNRFNYGGNG